MPKLISPIFMLLACLLASQPVHAKILQTKEFTDWTVYRQQTDAGNVCFMTSEPKKLSGNYDRDNRGETRVFVTHGPGKADRDVVSVMAGYSYQKQSSVDFRVDGKPFSFFTVEGRAWSMGPNDDAKAITAMKRGSKLVVTGISSRGNKTIDEYSLSGFTKAKAHLDQRCR
jgi:hypothetical protein